MIAKMWCIVGRAAICTGERVSTAYLNNTLVFVLLALPHPHTYWYIGEWLLMVEKGVC